MPARPGSDRPLEHRITARLSLDRPTAADLPDLHAIQADPALWRHFPSGVPDGPADTAALLADVDRAWESTGLGLWAVREGGVLVGTCGVGPFILGGRRIQNLGYRFAASAHGRGLATEAAAEALAVAREAHPDRPVIARVLLHNPASIRVLERVGLAEIRRGPASPMHVSREHPAPIRLLFADREPAPDLADALIALG